MKQTALLLDFDGTLVDSIPVMRAVYHEFMALHGKASSDAEFDRLNGPPLSTVIPALATAHNIDLDYTILAAQYLDLVRAAYVNVKPMPGAEDLLELARSQRRIAIVSANYADIIHRWLEQHRWTDWIEHVVDTQSAPAEKPDPAPYLYALERLQVPAIGSIAVEDTPTGATSALKAQLKTYLVGSDHHDFAEQHATCHNIDRLQDLIPLFSAAHG